MGAWLAPGARGSEGPTDSVGNLIPPAGGIKPFDPSSAHVSDPVGMGGGGGASPDH